ncbi:hypothetical protein NQ317_012563 [Molorchus minor]|uniref:Uncharacterized protein n=1 Tax=Molorchus minor TaxID=1323400 RepID=A0ABQ9K2M1_9CUCU|nr:hypothetical protein NQ317_012563 [Molorchus minor]
MVQVIYRLVKDLYMFVNKEGRCSDCEKIKYAVDTLGNVSYDRDYFEETVMHVEMDVLRVSIEEDIRKLCKGSVKVTGVTLHFIASNRGIEEIDSGVFENQSIKLKLDLHNNSLARIHKGVFKNMPVNELNLSFNKIVTIERGAFENLPRLYILYLNNNYIKEFYPNSLINTPDLLIFNMTFNNMMSLEEKHFLFMTKKEKVGIDLSYNELVQVHPKAFDGIVLYSVDLRHNKLPEEEFFYIKKLRCVCVVSMSVF